MKDETTAVGTRFIASAPMPSPVAFRTYLQHFGLTILDVALAAQVRLSTVWSIGQGLPIRAEHAQAVRTGLFQLTGVPFSEAIAIIPPEILQMTRGVQRTGSSH